MKVTFFDTETTGLVQSYKRPDRDRVIELYMVQYEYDGKDFKFIKEFESLFKVDKSIPLNVSKINNIYDKDLEKCKKFDYYLDDILAFSDTDIWIGQNVFFDVNMLEIELLNCGKHFHNLFIDCVICDTLVLKKVMNGGSAKQSALWEHYFPDREMYNAHRAKDDVLALVEITKAAIEAGDIAIENAVRKFTKINNKVEVKND